MTLPNLKRQDFTLTYETQGTNFLFEDLVSSHYLLWETVTSWRDNRVRVFARNTEIARISAEGLAYSSQYVRTAVDILKTSIGQAYQKNLRPGSALTLDEVQKHFELIGQIFKEYAFFDAFYWDAVYEQVDQDNKIKVGLVQDFKNNIRKKMNDLFFGPGSYLGVLASTVGAQGGVPAGDIVWYRENELVDLLKTGVKVGAADIAARQQAFVFYKDAQLYLRLIAGQEAVGFIESFVESAPQEQALKGRVANGKGQIVTGKVRVITRDYHDEATMQQHMAQMQEGEVLISETTEPTMMEAMRKASAIVTDIGGMLSHAAITARELQVPCIVGVDNASKVLKTGDMVEVDAERGVVRIIEKA